MAELINDNIKLVNPFDNKIINMRVLVPCNKLNTDIFINIKNILKKECEGKCIKYGFVSKIYKILEYSENEIDINNLDCSVFYNVKFSARLCFPIKNTLIIAKITTINKQLLLSENGPIKNFIKISELNYDNFKLDKDRNIIIKKQSKNNKLTVGMYVKVLIKAKKMNNNDDKIGTICTLIDIAKQSEINNFYEKKNRTEDIFDITNDEDLSGEDDYENEMNESDTESISNENKLSNDVNDDETDDKVNKNFIMI